LHVEFSDGDGLWIDADPARIEQIFGNLLTNAARYTPDGGNISVRVSREGGAAVVRVKDNGIGISADMLPQLFDPFAQADSSLDRTHGGLGIGLTLVRSLAEMHGGTASAFSGGIGCGSEFTVQLPLAERMNEGIGEQDRPENRTARRILVVDDNHDAGNSLALILSFHSHLTEVASNGVDALAAIQRFNPHIILLDIGLPEMDGYKVARRIRQTRRGNDILLVAITGYGQPNDRLRSQEAGFDLHLVKPVNIPELLRICSEWQRNIESPACV
jgi:CheY-like chemotaxis protein